MITKHNTAKEFHLLREVAAPFICQPIPQHAIAIYGECDERRNLPFQRKQAPNKKKLLCVFSRNAVSFAHASLCDDCPCRKRTFRRLHTEFMNTIRRRNTSVLLLPSPGGTQPLVFAHISAFLIILLIACAPCSGLRPRKLSRPLPFSPCRNCRTETHLLHTVWRVKLL